MTIEAIFQDSKPPYVVALPAIAATELRKNAMARKWRSWEIDLSRCTDIASIYRTFALAIDSPIKDSKNWNALSDILSDLGWAEAAGHLLLISGSKRFHQSRPEEHAELFDVLTSVGEHWHSWQNMRHPFKTVIFK
ncbi:MAG: barstar family protein [Elusimicrobia bacterium]|nr:barstar family protein [Elusimicrobiota bacterium]